MLTMHIPLHMVHMRALPPYIQATGPIPDSNSFTTLLLPFSTCSWKPSRILTLWVKILEFWSSLCACLHLSLSLGPGLCTHFIHSGIRADRVIEGHGKRSENRRIGEGSQRRWGRGPGTRGAARGGERGRGRGACLRTADVAAPRMELLM